MIRVELLKPGSLWPRPDLKRTVAKTEGGRSPLDEKIERASEEHRRRRGKAVVRLDKDWNEIGRWISATEAAFEMAPLEQSIMQFVVNKIISRCQHGVLGMYDFKHFDGTTFRYAAEYDARHEPGGMERLMRVKEEKPNSRANKEVVMFRKTDGKELARQASVLAMAAYSGVNKTTISEECRGRHTSRDFTFRFASEWDKGVYVNE